MKNNISDRVFDLAIALAKARNVAYEHIESEDGGTCNFDCPTVRLSRWRESDVKKACELAGGIYCQKWDGYHYNWHFDCMSGIGNRRTRMAEAFSDKMKELGYEASVWYAVD